MLLMWNISEIETKKQLLVIATLTFMIPTTIDVSININDSTILETCFEINLMYMHR